MFLYYVQLAAVFAAVHLFVQQHQVGISLVVVLRQHAQVTVLLVLVQVPAQQQQLAIFLAIILGHVRLIVLHAQVVLFAQ
jgi:tryptophan-rich sensory protein